MNTSSLYDYGLLTNVGPGGGDPCDGDSGGPLLLREEDLKWTLIGTLIGGGFDCQEPHDRSDNTSDWNSVAPLVSWINSLINGNEEFNN